MMPFFNARSLVWKPIDTGMIRIAGRTFVVGILFVVAFVVSSEGAESPRPVAAAEGSSVPIAASEGHQTDAPVADASPEESAAMPAPEAVDQRQAQPEVQADAAGDSKTPYFLQDTEAQQPVLGPEQQIAALTKRGMDMWHWGNHELAEEVFAHALSLAVPMELKRSLLLDLANLYDSEKQPLKVAAVLEKFRSGFPADRLTPQILLKLGLVYRDTGAYELATQRFFQVLNSTLQAPPEDLEKNRRLAMKARLEIAATYDLQGQFEEAQKFFSRVQLFDLEPADRERVQFRSAQLVYNSGAWLAAEERLKAFVLSYPDSSRVPEARYLRAKALEELDRRGEAVEEAMAILEAEYTEDTARSRQGAYWGRRTGNELANQLYEQGDFLGALSIYQALARVNEEPAWQWPAIYQVGLCFERLRLPDRALEAYQLIATPEGGAKTELSDALSALQDMAQWRLEHLDWVEDFSGRVQALSAEKNADT